MHLYTPVCITTFVQLKSFMLSGKFHMSDDMPSVLKTALGAMEGLSVFLGVVRRTSQYFFRVGFKVSFGVQSDAVFVR